MIYLIDLSYDVTQFWLSLLHVNIEFTTFEPNNAQVMYILSILLNIKACLSKGKQIMVILLLLL